MSVQRPLGAGAKTPFRAPAGHDRSYGKGLHGMVVESVGRAIVEHRTGPGTVLHAEELVRQYQVSRSVVRECVRVLESMGLVQARPHVGTRVLPRECWDLLDPRIIDWSAHSPGAVQQRRELLQLRAGIEPIAARLAAGTLAEAALTELVGCCETMSDAYRSRDKEAYFRADIRFHVLLLDACGNTVLQQLSHTVAAALASRYPEEHFFRPVSTPASVRRHFLLVDQLSAGDGAASEQAAREIVDQTLVEVAAA